MNIFEESLNAHRNLRGKLQITTKIPINNARDLSIYYSPGVGAVAEYLAKNPQEKSIYTSTNNTVAVISDGTSVLGLGDIGPIGALPVMEGKALLFKQFADIDAFPIVLNEKNPDKIIDIIAAIAPSFGGINLEDFAAPNCFYIEDELRKKLKMPIMHDDQHGTAIVVLAGIINACKVVNKDISKCKIVLIGAGAAGIAIAKILHKYANPQIVAVDSNGIITKNRHNLTPEKKLLLEFSNNKVQDGTLEDAIAGADIFIGVSRAGLLKPDYVKKMANNPIIFALANPEPEIMPELAKEAGAAVVATGRSDYPNQVNNVLAFPGVFRGALDNNTVITDNHKIAAAEAIARIVKYPTAEIIIPSALDESVVQNVASVFRS